MAVEARPQRPHTVFAARVGRQRDSRQTVATACFLFSYLVDERVTIAARHGDVTDKGIELITSEAGD